MSKLKYYYDLLSQPSRAVYIFLKLNNIPHEGVPVALRSGEHLTEEYRTNVNRFQKVPSINDNGFKLSESVAILRYFAREHKIPEHWYPQDSKIQAQVDEYMEWQHHNVRAHCSLYFQAKWVRPLITGKQEAPEKLAKLKERMEATLDQLENIWLNHDKKFMMTNTITIADLLAACEVEQPTMAGYDPTIGRPRLAKWLANVKAATNPVYDESHKFVYKFAAAAKL